MTNIFTVENFLGCIVSGRIRQTENPSILAFDVDNILGTGFVVCPERGIILTCDHVLPKEDRSSNAQFAFYTLDAAQNFRVFKIEKASAIQWENNDLIALRLESPDGLKTFAVSQENLSLAEQVNTIGFPKNHFESSNNNNTIIVRAVVSHIVSGYLLEFETDKPFIITMSGSPVFKNREIVGVAYKNKEYAIDQYLVERESKVENGILLKSETYEYKEVSKYGVFYKSAAWSSWLNGVLNS